MVLMGKYQAARALVEVAARVRSKVMSWASFVSKMDLGWGRFMQGQAGIANPLVEVGMTWT